MKPSEFIIVDWQDNQVVMLDQRLLPTKEIYARFSNYRDVADAIRNLTVRGAPAIGVAGAMGVALGILGSRARDLAALKKEMATICEVLVATRPTAVNLSWGVTRMRKVFEKNIEKTLDEIKQTLVTEAILIKNEDIAANKKMGEFGQTLLSDGDAVLTHCNAGALATAGYGTALGVIYAAIEAGKKIKVYADETRPVLQGARLTAWELNKCGIDVTVICDNMAASIMAKGLINKVIVGADRIAANGDTANKIGTYSVALAANYHKIPFYVAAPFSTIDPKTPTGKEIPIEEREHREVSHVGETRLTPSGVKIYNPAFDVTPAALISAIITEKGVLIAPYDAVLTGK